MSEVWHQKSGICQTSNIMSEVRQQTSDIWYQIYDIRRLLSYNCYQTSDVRYMSDVWNQTSHIRCLIWDMWHQITVIWQQKSDIRRLTLYNVYQKTDVWCHIRRLISDTSCCHQTSDNSYITYNIRCLMSFVSYGKSDVISDVWYQAPDDVCCHITVIRHLMLYVITVIRRLMSMMFVFWYQTAHVRYQTSDMTSDIW